VSATSSAVFAASASSFWLISPAVSPPSALPPTSFFTTSTVASGPPGSAARTLPDLSTTKTPRVVPFGAFFSPMAEMSVCAGSHSSVYGSFCFVLKVVFALGLSFERPKMP
jgi:hypothetical protein